MIQTIVIATTPTRYEWLEKCLKSLKGYDKYPVMILSDYTWFPGKMKFVVNKTKIDEFTMIADSMVIKDVSLFDIVFKNLKGKNVSYTKKIPHPYWMSLGKFKSETIRKLKLPVIKSKEEDLQYDVQFGKDMIKADPHYIGLFDDLPFSELVPNTKSNKVAYFEEAFGRKNRVIENKYFIKYQSIQ